MVVNYYNGEPTSEQIAERAKQNAESEARRQIEAERRQADAQRAAAEMQYRQRQQAAFAQAVDRLHAIREKYEARRKVAEALIGPLAEFYKLDQQIKRDVAAALGIAFNATGPLEHGDDRRLEIELRRRAGLSPDHNEVGVYPGDQDSRIAITVLKGISRNLIMPGGIDVGGHGIKVE